MLMPKRTKYRKMMRGRMTGKANRGIDISFGEFALQATEPACELRIPNNGLGSSAIHEHRAEHEVARPAVRDTDADMRSPDGFRRSEPQSHL